MKERNDLRADGFCGMWFASTKNNGSAVIIIPGSGTDGDNAVKQFAYINKAASHMI